MQGLFKMNKLSTQVKTSQSATSSPSFPMEHTLKTQAGTVHFSSALSSIRHFKLCLSSVSPAIITQLMNAADTC